MLACVVKRLRKTTETSAQVYLQMWRITDTCLSVPPSTIATLLIFKLNQQYIISNLTKITYMQTLHVTLTVYWHYQLNQVKEKQKQK